MKEAGVVIVAWGISTNPHLRFELRTPFFLCTLQRAFAHTNKAVRFVNAHECLSGIYGTMKE